MTTPGQSSSERSSTLLWLTAMTVTLATFMELLDTSIANVALPHIAGSVAASQDESTWVLSSYLVANAVVLPLSAWLSRVFGRKNYYMTCVALFTISSVLCGLAPSLGWLIVFRVFQGIGGGGLAPSEQAILVDTFPPARRATAFAVYSVAIVAAPAIGPTFGGWLTDSFSWRWCFFINLPVGILSLLLTSRLVHDPPEFTAERKRVKESGRLRIDVIGITLVAIGFGCLEFVLDKGQEDDWFASHVILGFAVVGGIALVSAVLWEIYGTDDPVVDISLMTERNFSISCMLYFLFGFTLYGTTILLPQMVQQLFGYTAEDAGLVITPGAVVVMAMVPIVVRCMKYIDARLLIVIGFTIIGGSLIYFQGLDLSADYRSIVIGRIIQGVGISMLFVPTSTLAYSRLPRNKNNKASSLTNLFRNVGGSAGIAFVTTALQRRSQAHQTYLGAHVTPYDPGVQSLLSSMKHTFMQAGVSPFDASQRAMALLYRTVLRQAQMLSYLDVFALLMTVAFMVPVVVFFAKPVAKAGASEGAH